MTSLIDVKSTRKKSKTRFYLHVVGISILTTTVIVGSILLLLFSNLDYEINLVVNIVLDGCYFSFLVFYFFVIFPVVKHYYKLFSKMNQVSFEHRRRLCFVEEKEYKTTNNVKFRSLCFTYKEGENEYQENLYVLDSDIQFEENKYYSIFTYQNVIISFEEIQNATV